MPSRRNFAVELATKFGIPIEGRRAAVNYHNNLSHTDKLVDTPPTTEGLPQSVIAHLQSHRPDHALDPEPVIDPATTDRGTSWNHGRTKS